MHRRIGAALAMTMTLAASPAPSARAESWCALPLDIHEWGVFVVGADGRVTTTPDLPSYFHTPERHAAIGPRRAVRDLPADSGVRTLPILHAYAPAGGFGGPIPLGIEVAFAGADAAAWYPQVDALRTAADAARPEALAVRARLLADRALRAAGARPSLDVPPADPTRQLAWDRLELVRAPPLAPPPTDVRWVAQARALGALWVTGGAEAERFVFYEARTREAAALAVTRGPTWTPTRRHYLITNRGRHAAHDVFVIHHEGPRAFVVEVPSIPAGKSAGFTLEDHPMAPGELAARASDRLRALLVDAASPEPPTEHRWSRDDCVMGRDPALPFERADGHRLFRGEVELLLSTWAERFIERGGTRVIYREDVDHLDAVMPLSLYTDMHHFIRLRRASLALVEGVVLP